MAAGTRSNGGGKPRKPGAGTGKNKAADKEPLSEIQDPSGSSGNDRFARANSKRHRAEESEREERQRKKEEMRDQLEREQLQQAMKDAATVDGTVENEQTPPEVGPPNNGPGDPQTEGDKENSPAPSEVSPPLATQRSEEEQRALAKRDYVATLVQRKHIRSYEQKFLNAKEYFATKVIRSLKFPESGDLMVGGQVYNGLARRLEVKPDSQDFRDLWTGDSGAGNYSKLCIRVLQSKRSSITSALKKAVEGKKKLVLTKFPHVPVWH